jgi:hypothetical protein
MSKEPLIMTRARFAFAITTLASALLACSSDEAAPHPVPVDAATDAAAADGTTKDAAQDQSPREAAEDAGGG